MPYFQTHSTYFREQRSPTQINKQRKLCNFSSIVPVRHQCFHSYVTSYNVNMCRFKNWIKWNQMKRTDAWDRAYHAAKREKYENNLCMQRKVKITLRNNDENWSMERKINDFFPSNKSINRRNRKENFMFPVLLCCVVVFALLFRYFDFLCSTDCGSYIVFPAMFSLFSFSRVRAFVMCGLHPFWVIRWL